MILGSSLTKKTTSCRRLWPSKSPCEWTRAEKGVGCGRVGVGVWWERAGRKCAEGWRGVGSWRKKRCIGCIGGKGWGE